MKIICSDQIALSSTESTSDKIRRIALFPEVACNLTETWTYPDGMPQEIVFNIKKEKKLVGQAAYKSIRWFNRKASLSLFIHPKHQRQGIGTMVIQHLISHGFDHLNLHRLEAEVISYNQAAMALMKRAGFVQEGCLRQARYYNGAYADILSFGLLRQEYRGK
ncbi:MAG: GNAT family protein [Bacteroidales bacterium]|nr:GNAT family N-acetyltransferase [Bacteroidales bacterium]NCU35578.1 N-acetyltransferase [Candidatus Falkowbacteria bacterium]MDD2630863.1 GNAT family protein [Bacteroidales bacterium]MDD3526008.1 GNAT family protein [Bacteroidales bacterium]MDD4176468.1 GNAT family protein [Bacteroidales bacterium]